MIKNIWINIPGFSKYEINRRAGRYEVTAGE